MRIVVSERRGRRGEGLGNEFFALAKGWIASQELDAHLVGPSWGINARRYYRNFGTSRLDVVAEELLRRLPHHAFTEEDYVHAGHVDFGSAIRTWAEAKGLQRKGSFIVTVNGMYGGYPAIRSARPFLATKLLNSRDALRNIYEMSATLDRAKLFVAVHMRGGDFGSAPSNSDVRTRFNLRIPDEWFVWTCRALQQEFGDRVEFRFFTDRTDRDYDDLVAEFSPGQRRQSGLTECSDILLMAQADLRICSISSYSLIASFLSGGPYLWYEPQLHLADGIYSLWAHEPVQRLEGSLSQQSRAFVQRLAQGSDDRDAEPLSLGIAMATGEPLPRDLVTMLRHRLRTLDPRTNLLEYGSLRRESESLNPI